MNRYKVLIFDWDGTLLDSIGLISDCIKRVAEEFKAPVPSDEDIRNFIAYNVDVDLLGIFPTIDKEGAVECYRSYYNNRERLVTGALETLKLLKKRGAMLAIATNNNQMCLKNSPPYQELANLFSVVKTTNDGYIKPEAGMVLSIIKELNMPKDATLMIGDSITDMLLARNAGIDALAVTYGLNSKQDLLDYSPMATIDRLEQLLDFI
jgi:phosphoglycolate phosphatase